MTIKKLGLGVLGLGERRSIISAGANSELWEVAQLCEFKALQAGKHVVCTKPFLNDLPRARDILAAMEEACAKGQPVKIKEVLAKHGLDELFNTGNP